MVDTGYGTGGQGRSPQMEAIAAVILLVVFAQVAAIAGWESRDGFENAGDASSDVAWD
jgi:hypothetical protein